jgi:phosphoglycerate dehydrogenase-like enzyme
MPDDPSLAPRRSPAGTHLTICAAHRFTLWQAPGWFAPRLRERWPELQVMHVPGYDALGPELPLMNIFVGFSLRPEQLARAPRLRWVHSTAAGIAQLTYPEVRERGIVVTSARGIHAGTMAEHVLGMLVALARRFPDAFRWQAQARWAQQEIWDAASRPRELRGSVLLIAGFGAIGQAVARLVQPLGMRVWASTLSGRGDSSLVERILPASAFDEALADADFVLLAVPETPATKGMMGAPQFARMKRAAYLINVSRGSMVDEPALIAALENRTMAGAALDVASSEPLSPESPLWRLPNVFITPHLSAASEPLWERQAELLIDNLDRWFSSRELRNVVNLEAGY